MEKRWLMLVLLFLVRTITGIQYQSVASVSSLLREDLVIDFAQLGILIGLYQMPGVVLAFPGGLLGGRFDDKRIVAWALGLMAMGGLVIGASDSYAVAVLGRLLSGVGAVLLNVLLTKMVADWFAGREIVTAMSILVSSWPLGISLGLISLGPLALASSWSVVMHLTAAACLLGLVLVLVVYHRPPPAGDVHEMQFTGLKLSRQELWLVALAGLIWALFNVGFASLRGFGPEFLTSTGYTVAGAGALVSAVTWVVIPSVQFGGYFAERLGRPNFTLVICFIGIGTVMCLLPLFPYPLVLFVALGLLFGPPAGIIMALPAEVLHPEDRAPGMGVFYTVYYGGMSGLTALAGLSRDVTDSAAAPLVFGGLLLFISTGILGLFRAVQRRSGASCLA
jgi:predicted MFS family arabinose efflux permease